MVAVIERIVGSVTARLSLRRAAPESLVEKSRRNLTLEERSAISRQIVAERQRGLEILAAHDSRSSDAR
jgi:hypothetical protein